jgi:teichuronic acid biosynthesis glycosyltransferase TuaC
VPSPLRVLIVTNLFPSNSDPGYAPFNRQQFAHLGTMAEVEVLGVVPWRFGTYHAAGSSKDVLREERIDGLRVLHPRYPSIRGVPSLNATLLAASLLPRIAAKRKGYDVILASYAYPDGCAGVILGEILKLPVVVKCHGSDLNRVPKDLPARVQLRRLLPRASSVVTVSKKLGDAAISLGVPREKIRVVYNGIDRDRFRPVSSTEARKQLNLPEDAELVVYVGLLADYKGTRDLLAAIPKLATLRPGVITALVGDGPLTKEVHEIVEHGNPGHGRVMAVGRVKHDEVPLWMAASDVLCLPSWDEGMPNVVREAHAVGRPVVATRVGGIPEAVFRPELGRLVPPRDPDALATALAAQLAESKMHTPEEIAKLAIVPSWDESARALLDVLKEARR